MNSISLDNNNQLIIIISCEINTKLLSLKRPMI